MPLRKILSIIGASSDFGQALVREALDAGYRVIGTVCSEEVRNALETVAPGQASGRLLDVTNLAAIEPTIAATKRDIDPLDMLVDSIGYGHEGILEESPLAEMRRQFKVNLSGMIAMIQTVLPCICWRRRGHILDITFMGDYITIPGIAYHYSSKFALEGVFEALGKEVVGLGIAITAMAPGSLCAGWTGRSMVHSPCTIADYDALSNPVHQACQEKSGKQPGNPHKAARAVLQAINAENPPAHLLLGSDALGLVRQRLKALEEGVVAWEGVMRLTDG